MELGRVQIYLDYIGCLGSYNKSIRRSLQIVEDILGAYQSHSESSSFESEIR